jgi:ABC-2 type transport system permease protein
VRTFLILWRRELASFFLSPVAYVVTVFFLVVMGVSFWMLTLVLTEKGANLGAMSHLFGSIFFWIALLVIAPLLTMRSFAEERRSGAFEMLMTAPVRDATVVLAKYAGALTFYGFMWIPTLAYAVVLRAFSPLTARVDPGALAGGYLGAFAVGALLLAAGLFASSLTRSQIVSAIVGFALGFSFFLAGFLPWIWPGDALQRAGAYFSPILHMLDFSRGVVDTRALAFYAINTALLLFLTVRRIEARRWKA